MTWGRADIILPSLESNFQESFSLLILLEREDQTMMEKPVDMIQSTSIYTFKNECGEL